MRSECPKKIIISTGGTGGHIYPALVTAEELRRRGWDILFVGVFGKAAAQIVACGFKYCEVKAQGFVSKSVWDKLKALFFLIKGISHALKELRSFQPSLVLGFGGYSSIPAVLAAVLCRTPVILHEQNAAPGHANRWLGRLAQKVALSFEDSRHSFPAHKTVLTGYPFRSQFSEETRAQALARFGLKGGRKTILVFGGSQGSRTINEIFMKVLAQIPKETAIQMVHLAGKDGSGHLKALYAALPFPFFVTDYWEGMATAYAAADVVVCRSGAGTVTELSIRNLAAILIPYPHAASHQLANARILERRKTAAIIQEKDLNPSVLGDKIFWALGLTLPQANEYPKYEKDVVLDADKRLADEVELSVGR